MRYLLIALLLTCGCGEAVEDGLMFCPVCQEAGLKSTVHWRTGHVTQVWAEPFYWNEDGEFIRNPDPNATTSEYYCSEGHKWEVISGEKRNEETGEIEAWERVKIKEDWPARRGPIPMFGTK